MPISDNRCSVRVICVFPVRIHARKKELVATTCDCSRTGLRLRLDASELGENGDADLISLANAVSDVLGSRFEADLHFQMLGTLVQKELSLVRVGQEDGHGGEVELGCLFASPLSDDESAMLGLGLPPLGVSAQEAVRDVPGPKLRGDANPDGVERRVEPRYQAWLHPQNGTGAKPLSGESVGLRGEIAVISLEHRGPPRAADELAAVAAELTSAYGRHPRLEILDGTRVVWAGPTEIRHVEAVDANRVRVHLSTERAK